MTTPCSRVTTSLSNVILPMTSSWKNMPWFGPHCGGKIVLCLSEAVDCGYTLLARCGAWKNGQYKQLLTDIALFSRKGSKPFSVEYIAAAEDGMGRLYARQSCAQRLLRILRTILYGDSHWEVDISGAHYELLRIGSQSSTLPPVAVGGKPPSRCQGFAKEWKKLCDKTHTKFMAGTYFQLRLSTQRQCQAATILSWLLLFDSFREDMLHLWREYLFIFAIGPRALAILHGMTARTAFPFAGKSRPNPSGELESQQVLLGKL